MIRALILLLALTAMPCQAADLYLVRHAEKQLADGDPDPGLTAVGLDRAKHLAQLLASTNIEHIYSSNYRRTRLTAAPLALDLDMDVELYDPGELAAFAEMLKNLTGNALVVGHSNTTPKLVELLGGMPGEPIDESEYDRVYLVQMDRDDVTTILLHLPPRTIDDD